MSFPTFGAEVNNRVPLPDGYVAVDFDYDSNDAYQSDSFGYIVPVDLWVEYNAKRDELGEIAARIERYPLRKVFKPNPRLIGY